MSKKIWNKLFKNKSKTVKKDAANSIYEEYYCTSDGLEQKADEQDGCFTRNHNGNESKSELYFDIWFFFSIYFVYTYCSCGSN